MPNNRSARLKADSTLLLVAVIWGSAFVAQRIAAINSGVFTFNGLRFLIGALVLLPFIMKSSIRTSLLWRNKENRNYYQSVGLLGFFLFGGAALQQWGLRYTTAGNAGFITGLYVVIIPILLAFGWRQRPRRAIWIAALLSALGLYLLSINGRMQLNRGDILELAGSFLWAFHIILLSRFLHKINILPLLIGQYLVCGVLSLIAGLFFELNPGTLHGLATSWAAILYTGVLSVGLGYTLQGFGQKVAPPADAAILLSMEAVFAAVFGWILLHEAMSIVQLLGCGLILVGMLTVQLSPPAESWANAIAPSTPARPPSAGGTM
jgi:drug/metabolite transporter (DMT)-like permease